MEPHSKRARIDDGSDDISEQTVAHIVATINDPDGMVGPEV